jgi:hypothetical protein
MFEVIAKKFKGYGDFISIVIRKDNQEMILNEDESNMFVKVLQGKKGVMSILKKGEYQSDEIILFSCNEPIALSTIED